MKNPLSEHLANVLEEDFFILKEDKTPTSIGGELRQICLGGSPISFQDKASGGSQAWSVEECFAFDHAAARTPEAFLNRTKTYSMRFLP